jgi:hypothetical protein
MQAAYIERITADRLIHSGPCVLFRCRPQVAVAGQHVSIYDGMDLTSGVLVDQIIAAVNDPATADYGPGVYLSRGLFVHIHTAGDAATVVWLPVQPEQVS